MFLGDLRRTLTVDFLRHVTATGGFHSTSSVLLRLRRLFVSAWAVRGRSNRCKLTEQGRSLNWRRRFSSTSTGCCKETENSSFFNLPTSGCSSSGMFSKMSSSRSNSLPQFFDQILADLVQEAANKHTESIRIDTAVVLTQQIENFVQIVVCHLWKVTEELLHWRNLNLSHFQGQKQIEIKMKQKLTQRSSVERFLIGNENEAN